MIFVYGFTVVFEGFLLLFRVIFLTPLGLTKVPLVTFFCFL